MEIDRKTWSWTQWQTSPYILSDFSSWGFVTAVDGSPIDVSNLESWSTVALTTVHGMNIKWQYDKLASNLYNTFTIGVTNEGVNVEGWGYEYGTFTGVRLNYTGGTMGTGYNLIINSDSYYGGSSDIIINPKSLNPKVFFIPLINNGFLLNMRANGTNTGQENYDPDGPAYTGQTPTLKTIYWTPDNTPSQGTNKTVIALPPSERIKSLGYTYIVFQHNEPYSNQVTDINSLWTDPNNIGNLQYIESISSIDYSKHINITQDVCTLIRYPYQNAFLDNLYIMSTMPKQFNDDVAYFSLNGRNFMKVFYNLVVELPST